MRTLNIELPDKHILRLGESISGDVFMEIDLRKDHAGPPKKQIMVTVPEDRRNIIANFLYTK